MLELEEDELATELLEESDELDKLLELDELLELVLDAELELSAPPSTRSSASLGK
ncbi:hypothetical protein R50076_02980 [Gilvimarinus japonicus]